MGREYYNGSRSICSSKSKSKSSEANGCIAALYHFFHVHHFYFPSRHHHHQPTFDSPSRNPNGLVAPRNSLELTEESPPSINYKEKDSFKFNIPVGGKKSNLRALLVNTSSDYCSSPSAKTPNVVARLMGLDLLPDNLDLNKSLRNGVIGHRPFENGSGTRSLPESPRISSARISDSDIRRLSLQLSRENKHEESGRWRLKDEESPSPRHNGRQLVKQIKERVITRRLGMDITNLLENRRAGAAQNKIEQRKVRSRSSQKENAFVFKQDKVSRQPTKKLTISKDFKENLKSGNEQPLRPIKGCTIADRESQFSLHSTPNNRNRQRRTLISSTSTKSKSDLCDPLDKKKCKKTINSNDIFNISEASSDVSAKERPRKQMKRAEGPERHADATISSGQMYKYEEKLPQEPPSSNFCHTTTISATFSTARRTTKFDDFEHLPGMKNLKEEEERVVAEIERHIVDALVLEMVKMATLEATFSNAY